MLLASLPFLVLLPAPLVMVGVRLLRPRFAYFWLITVLSAQLAWVMVLLQHSKLPLGGVIVAWQPASFFTASPSLLIDWISWPYALVLTTLVLAMVLTDVARLSETSWRAWAYGLTLALFGLLAVLAGNPLTLLLAWAALDLFELLILFNQILSSAVRERIILAYTARVAGILLLLWADMASGSPAASSSFAQVPPEISIYLLLAAGLRLGVLPWHQPFLEEPLLSRGLGALLRLTPAAASLVLLTRTATAGVPPVFVTPLLILTALAAIYAGASWLSARDELSGRSFWILGGASLAVAAALRAQPEASLAWSVATLLSGGLIFLASTRHRRLVPLILLGLLGFTGLPFTPAWQGVRLYAPPFNALLPLFLFAQALLLAGYLRHALRSGIPIYVIERWVWVIYPTGLALLPGVHFLITWWSSPQPGQISQFPAMSQSWPGLAVVAILGLLVFLRERSVKMPAQLLSTLKVVFSFNWLYRLIWSGYRSLARWSALANTVLEGEGGILWTLLLLALLLSLLVQLGAGGQG